MNIVKTSRRITHATAAILVAAGAMLGFGAVATLLLIEDWWRG